MKNILLFTFCGVLMFACQNKDANRYVVRGNLDNISDSTKIYLVYYPDGEETRDSTYAFGGKFEFSGDYDEPFSATILVDRDGKDEYVHPYYFKDKLPLYVEKGIIVVSDTDSIKNATITGSRINDESKEWKELSASIDQRRKTLYDGYYSASPEERSTDEFRANFEKESDSIKEEERRLALDFIKSHPDSYFALDRLYNTYVGYSPDPEEAETTYAIFSDKVRNSKKGNEYAEKIEAWKATSVGSIAPDFTQNDPDGNPVSLSDFRGRYVLIDFWASWCGPCRAENPHVVKAYNEYKDKGFTILGVSLDGGDDGREKWLKAIEDDNLTWTQVSDLKSWKNEAAKLYAVNAIPANYLLDPDGKVLATNLRGDDLTAALAEYLD